MKAFLNRKNIIFVMFCVLLPIVLIVSFYTITYNNNKVVPFEDSEYNIKMKNVKYFKFNFYCEEYVVSDGNKSAPMKFRGAVSHIKGYQIRNVNYKVVLTSDWNKDYKTNYGSATNIRTFKETDDVYDSNGNLNLIGENDNSNYSSASINSFNKKYPFKPVLFVEIKHPTAYVELSWEERKNTASSNVFESKTALIKYDFKEYFVNGLSKKTVL
ncbi:MAG: hypothetical protein ACRC5M_01065 [Anaeroplasmataceae bacterium]